MALNWKVKNRRQDLWYEIHFTRAYRELKKKYLSPVELEVEVMKLQYPAIFHEVEEQDLFAGRIEFGKVGFGIQTQTGGFGYYIDEKAVIQEIEHKPGSAAYREGLLEILEYWKAENSTQKVLDGMPVYLKNAMHTGEVINVNSYWEVMPLPAHPIIRMAGTYLDYDKLVRLGLPGLEEEILKEREKASGENREISFYNGMYEALQIVKNCFLWYSEMCLRLSAKETGSRREELNKMAEVLELNVKRAPKSLREAIQLIWLYSLMTPAVSFGRMDIYLGDLYVHDVENGIITEEEALSYIQSLFRLIDHIDCDMDSRVIIGGYGRRNPENADRFDLVAIEACRTVKEVSPQFTLRFCKDTPKEVWDASMTCIGEGRSYPLLYNDERYVPGMMRAANVSREIAERYIPLGCGEMEFDHYSYHTPSGLENVNKILEMAIYGGYDPVLRKQVGLVTKPLKDCESFEEFLNNYKRQLHHYTVALAEFERYEYDAVAKIHSFILPSILYDGCIEKGKSAFNGGTVLHGTLEINGFANASDSLVTIKKLIFEEKRYTAEQLLEAMEDNFAGHERMLKEILEIEKYGNDNSEADDMFLMLYDYVSSDTREQARHVGLGSYLTVSVNNQQNTTLGRWTGAMPDGRKAGMPLGNANSPTPGSDKNGVTALLNSMAKPDQSITAGAVQNVRFSKEMFQHSREKVIALITDYFKNGGWQLMVSVVGKDDLKNALEHPEEYSDLIVRVGGFSARFVNLSKDVQLEIYERTTY